MGSFILFLPIRFYAKRCVQQRKMVPVTAVALQIQRWIKPPNREAVVTMNSIMTSTPATVILNTIILATIPRWTANTTSTTTSTLIPLALPKATSTSTITERMVDTWERLAVPIFMRLLRSTPLTSNPPDASARVSYLAMWIRVVASQQALQLRHAKIEQHSLQHNLLAEILQTRIPIRFLPAVA